MHHGIVVLSLTKDLKYAVLSDYPAVKLD